MESNVGDTASVTSCETTADVTYSSEIYIPMGCPGLDTEAPNAIYNFWESYEVQLPTEVCSLNISIDSSALQFDDHVVFTLNQHLLFLSDSSSYEYFVENDGTALYDWEILRGQEMNLSFEPLCTIPCHQSYQPNDDPSVTYTGRFQQEFHSDELAYLVSSFDSAVFGVVALGDNDEQDCWLEGLSYTLHMTVPN